MMIKYLHIFVKTMTKSKSAVKMNIDVADLSDSCPVLQDVQVRQHVNNIWACAELRTVPQRSRKEFKSGAPSRYQHLGFIGAVKVELLSGITVTEVLTVEGYQTPLKVVSSSYLGSKRLSSSSFLKPRRSTTLVERKTDSNAL